MLKKLTKALYVVYVQVYVHAHVRQQMNEKVHSFHSSTGTGLEYGE
jgi:hypothetical protein